MSAHRRPSTTSRRPISVGIALALVLVALAIVHAACEGAKALSTAAATESAWIWAPSQWAEDGALAAVAARDVQVPFVPRSAVVELTADEEYVLFVNGRAIGSNRYREPATLDRFDIRRELRRGTNRIAIEVRSTRGVGALYARIVASATRPEASPATRKGAAAEGEQDSLVVVTDASWRFGRVLDSAVIRPSGGLPVTPAEVLGLPPVGRWPRPKASHGVPRLARQRKARRPWPAQSFAVANARRIRWRGLDRLDETPLPANARLLFDWGSEVTGYLSLRFPDGDPREGLLWFTDQTPETPLPPADAVLLGAGGQEWWSDAVPRTFRYVSLVGPSQPVQVEVHPVVPERVERVLATADDERGVFGLERPGLVTSVEHEVWGELERLAGGAGR